MRNTIIICTNYNSGSEAKYSLADYVFPTQVQLILAEEHVRQAAHNGALLMYLLPT